MKPILKYPGAKWGIANWIVGHFPEHHSYLEAFFGSGGVLFNKPRSNIETVNDLDGEVVNLFECIKHDPEKLARELFFTPYSLQVYDSTYTDSSASDPFDKAVRFLARCNQSHGFRTSGGRVGWKRDVAGRERGYAARAWADLPDTIIEAADRLREVQIECTPAAQLIPKFNNPNVLIYCDPPYLLSVRRGKQYRHEMTEQDHMELLAVLKNHCGPVVISGYQSQLYDAELAGWSKASTTTTDLLSQRKTEVIWMNFEPSIEQIKMEV